MSKAKTKPVRVSYFQRISNNTPTHSATIEEILNRIENDPNVKTLQAIIRAEPDEDKQRELKLKLPAWTPSALITSKEKEKSIEEQVSAYSGYLNADFDDFETKEDVEKALKKLKKDKFVWRIWHSVRGKLSALVKVDGGIEKHGENFEMAYEYFNEKYGLLMDKSCRNVNRLRYMSHSKVYKNEYAQKLYFETKKEAAKVAKVYTSHPVATQEEVFQVLDQITKNKIDLTRSYSDWVRIGFGIAAEMGESGEDVFVQVSQFNDSFDEEETRYKYKSLLKDVNPERASIASFFWCAKQAGLVLPSRTKEKQPNSLTFWFANKKGLQISLTALRDWMHKEGFLVYFYDKENYWIVKKTGGIVEKWVTSEIRKHVLNFIDAMDDDEVLAEYLDEETGELTEYKPYHLAEVIVSKARWSFSEDKIDFLDRLPQHSFIEGYKNNMMFFFKNAFVIVDKDGQTFHEYSELEKYGYIWSEQILDAEIDTSFCFDPANPSQFFEFLMCVCTQPGKPRSEHDPKRLDAIRSMTGYLLNPYKHGKRYGIILTDELSTDTEDRGRTGKSEIFAKALSHLTNTTFIQCKRIDFSSQFALQKIRLSDKLVVMNDLPKGIPFDIFYNIVTDGIDVEKKNRDQYEVFAKVLMTTNTLPTGSGDSVKDRFVEFQFSNYFSVDHSPVDEFGNWFFSDEWTKEEWTSFYFELFACCSMHLQELAKDRDRLSKGLKMNYGIIRVEDESLELKRFKSRTRQEFAEWSDGITNGKEYNRADLISHFKEVSNLTSVTTQKFTAWMNALGEHRKRKYTVRKSGSKYLVSLL